MDMYGVFLTDADNPWLHRVPRLMHVSDSDWSQGHFHLLHAHKELAEILLICNDRCIYTLDHNRYEVSAGDIVLCNQGAAHEELAEKDSSYQTRCISIANVHLPHLPEGYLLPADESPIFHQPAQFDELNALVDGMIHCVRNRAPYFREQSQGLMLAALAVTQRMVAERAGQVQREADPLCVEVETYIDAHYAEELTLERLGRVFHISPYHLAHVFKQQTGYSLKQYILRLRIGQSQIMIMDTRLPISEIARSVGFEDAAHFSKLFSKYVGMSPSEYRIYRRKE